MDENLMQANYGMRSEVASEDVSGITSVLGEAPNSHHIQRFKLGGEKCAKLTVFVDDGKNDSWLSGILHKPDLYVKLEIKGTPNGIKKTATSSYQKNLVWNQAFEFVVPDDLSDQDFTLDLSLVDEKLENVQSSSINLRDRNFVQGEMISLQVAVGKSFKINLRLLKEYLEADLRYNLELCDEEQKFLSKRREKIFLAMNKILAEERRPLTQNQVPVVGVLGSGGGFRAMIGMSAAFSCLSEEGIMDCVSHVAGLSGSTWYLSFLYSQPDFPAKKASKFKTELKESASKRWPLVIAKGIDDYKTECEAKYKIGQPLSLTDLFGHFIGDMLLTDRKETTLSSQSKVVHDGSVPLPMYSCLNVKRYVAENVFQEWVEFSPYEIGISKYGTFMKSEQFGNKYYVGNVIKSFPEMPLHFLQGIWGSAYNIWPTRLESFDADKENAVCERVEESSGSEDEESDVPKGEHGSGLLGTKERYMKALTGSSGSVKSRRAKAGLIFNSFRGLDPKEAFPLPPTAPTQCGDDEDFKGFFEPTNCSARKMYLVDAGLNFNIPFPVLLRPQRGIELYLSFDFSDRGLDEAPPFAELRMSEQWARLNKLPFPPVAQLADKFEKEEMREFYVFEDKDDLSCPVIIQFVLCNKLFRKFKAPGVERETEREKKFADFDILYPKSPYASSNFHYTSEQFERLHDLVEFNVALGIAEIKKQIEALVERKQNQ